MATDVIVYPFGKIEIGLLEAVRAAVGKRFGIGTTLGQELPVPARAYSRERRQYRSTEFLHRLANLSRDGDHVRLGVVAIDLFAPELNFVFGEASAASRVAVFSTARLDPRFYEEPEDQQILLRRAVTEGRARTRPRLRIGPLHAPFLRDVVLKYAHGDRPERKRVLRRALRP